MRGLGSDVVSCGRVPGPGIDAVWDLSRDLAPSGDWKPRIVIHAAAKVGGYLQPLADALPFLDVNTAGTLRLARWCASIGVQKLVVVSGALVYGRWEKPRTEEDPVQPWLAGAYAVSKWLGEQSARLIEREGCRLSVLRLSSLWGEEYENGLPQKLLKRAQSTGSIRLDPPFDDAFDLLYYRDAARTVARSALSSESGLWNVGGGKTTTLREIAQACARELNVKLELSDTPAERSARTINWVDDQKARTQLGHTSATTLDAVLSRMAQKTL